jgi:hypothetical protein
MQQIERLSLLEDTCFFLDKIPIIFRDVLKGFSQFSGLEHNFSGHISNNLNSSEKSVINILKTLISDDYCSQIEGKKLKESYV